MARGQGEGDERGREEHLDDGGVAPIAGEVAGEWVGVVDAKTLGGCYAADWSDRCWSATVQACVWDGPYMCDLPTARQLWSWLKVMKLSAGLAMVDERGKRERLVRMGKATAEEVVIVGVRLGNVVGQRSSSSSLARAGSAIRWRCAPRREKKLQEGRAQLWEEGKKGWVVMMMCVVGRTARK